MADAAKKEDKAEAPRGEGKKKGGGGKLVPLLLVVNSALLAGVLALLVLKPGGAAAAKAEKGEEHAAPAEHGHGAGGEKGGKGEKGKEGKENMPGPSLRLPDFVVHLRDAEADRYVRVAFELELGDEKAKEVLTARTPQIRDAFLSYLSDRSADELRGSENMAKMKAALSQRIGDIAPGIAVRGFYIADLVVQ
jgi:flagellar FliL protein